MSDHDNITKQYLFSVFRCSSISGICPCSKVGQWVGCKLELGPLNKAMKIHEIHISSGGDVRSKFLPSDVFYENVKIKESRRHRRVETDLESDLDE